MKLLILALSSLILVSCKNDTPKIKNPSSDPKLPNSSALSKFKIAKSVPGKPGYCINPFTGGEVDVRGIPPGRLIMDPYDQNPEHKFRLPQLTD